MIVNLPIFQGRTNVLDITNLKREKESKEKTQEEHQRKKKTPTITSLPSSAPVIPLGDAGGDVAAALTMGDRYRQYFPS